jgi:hypothetical protein
MPALRAIPRPASFPLAFRPRSLQLPSRPPLPLAFPADVGPLALLASLTHWRPLAWHRAAVKHHTAQVAIKNRPAYPGGF